MTQTTSQVEAARRFHDTYERLAPKFGYTTREDTRVFDPDSPNGKLMTAVCAELASQQEVAAPVGVVSVSPLHVGVGWVGGYVPKNGEKLYLAAARVPVASPAEPVPLSGDLVIKALLAMDAEARKRGEMFPQTADEQERDTKAVRNVIESLEFYTTGNQCRNGRPSVKNWPNLPATPPVGAGGAGVMDARPDSFHSDSGKCDRVQVPGPTDAEPDHQAILGAVFKYIGAHQSMEAAMKHGVNVHGAISEIIGATDNLRAAILAKGGDQ